MSKNTLNTPLGAISITVKKSEITEVFFIDDENTVESESNEHPVLCKAVRQLSEYFSGERNQFDLPLNPAGTPFQKSVWKALQQIPYGTTITYAKLSQMLGNPKAVRAVGAANGQNPLPIIIPCHRVVGSDNNLIGYSAGVERKRWLLQHEGALLL